jgi:hypothetical protein
MPNAYFHCNQALLPIPLPSGVSPSEKRIDELPCFF